MAEEQPYCLTAKLQEKVECFADDATAADDLLSDPTNIPTTFTDFNEDGEINYSEFLTACINKEKAVTIDNLQFALHHFDVDNSGYITAENLQEVFRRQGKMMTLQNVQDIIEKATTPSNRLKCHKLSEMLAVFVL